jgi:exo-beta-1,3-glucanase (GH17 family)
MYGIGFSVNNGETSNAYINNESRLNDALNKLENLGYNIIRTWGYSDYSSKIYENIKTNSRNIKVLQGMYINTSDLQTCKTKLDNMMANIISYHDYIFAISLLNETENNVTAATLNNLINYFHSCYGNYYKVTASFLAPTLNKQNFSYVFDNLDFVSVNEYGLYFEYQEDYTHIMHLENIVNKTYTQVSDDKMIVLTETGWQHNTRGDTVSTSFNDRLNPDNAADFYRKITKAIYNTNTRFTFMLYFNLANAKWKDMRESGGYNKNNWGIFNEGDGEALGEIVHPDMSTNIDILINN